MKNILDNIRKILIIVIILLSTYSLKAQAPPPPGGAAGNENTSDNSQGGRGAPIGGGLFILLGLRAVYGGRKIYQFTKTDLVE